MRTVVGAVGTFSDLDLDAVADLRLAVDEACTRLIRSAAPDATLVIVVDPVRTWSWWRRRRRAPDRRRGAKGGFSWHVLSSLTDDVQTFHNGQGSGPDFGRVFGIP